MSTYREIIGKKIKKVSSDPSSGTEGEMWYNSTTGTLRGPAILSAWSSAGPMITARYAAGSGTQTAALASAGYNGSNSALTEEYNGSGWSAGGALPVASRGGGAAGTQTATIYAGGYESSNTGEAYTYNGTAWTGIPALNTARRGLTNNMAGTTTAAIVAGGLTGVIADSEEYNGSSWSEGDNLNTARADCAAGGIQTASFLAGGGAPSVTAGTELYDGTSWTAGGSLNTARKSVSGGGAQTAGIVFGGDTGSVSALTETFDGTSWTETGDMATARHSGAPANQPGANSSTLAGGGVTTDYVTITEEWNSSTTAVTSAVWASGNNLNTVRTLGGSAIPTVSDGIVFGGSGYTNVTEQYDGTTWTEKGDLNTARGYISGFGTSTAAVAAGGYTAPNNPQSLVEEFNGSAWSEETNLPASRKSAGNCGTLTAGLIMGGSTAQPYAANVVNTAFEYNGTSWTATPGNLPEAKGQGMSGGTQTAAYYAAGRIPPNTYTQKTAEYNGSSFSEGGDVVSISETTAQGAQGATGTQTAGLATGGQPAKTNTYDGTTWATTANFNTGRNKGMGGGTATAALIAGGGAAPGNTAATEEFTSETTSINIEDFTTS